MSDLLLMRCGGQERAFLSPIPPTDPNFASVAPLAINDNQADTTTAFDDQSNSNHTLTAVNQAQYDTAQAPSGMTSSGLFDGTGDQVTAADHADWRLGAGDFTIEFMLRWNSVGAQAFIAHDDYNAGGNVRNWGIYFDGATALIFYYFVSNVATEKPRTWSPSANTWYHVEFDRSGNNLYHFVDGTQLGATSDVTGVTIDSNVAKLHIGGLDGGLFLNGWMSNVRITKGVARHTANFTPPTLPLPTS